MQKPSSTGSVINLRFKNVIHWKQLKVVIDIFLSSFSFKDSNWRYLLLDEIVLNVVAVEFKLHTLSKIFIYLSHYLFGLKLDKRNFLLRCKIGYWIKLMSTPGANIKWNEKRCLLITSTMRRRSWCVFVVKIFLLILPTYTYGRLVIT